MMPLDKDDLKEVDSMLASPMEERQKMAATLEQMSNVMGDFSRVMGDFSRAISDVVRALRDPHTKLEHFRQFCERVLVATVAMDKIDGTLVGRAVDGVRREARRP